MILWLCAHSWNFHLESQFLSGWNCYRRTVKQILCYRVIHAEVGNHAALFLISTTQDHSSYVYGQHPIVEWEYLHKSRPSVQWKLQIWGWKCRLKHLFLYQFAGCLIWPHFRKIQCSCLSEVDIACVTLIMGGVNYICCYPIWRFQNDGNRVNWVRDIFSSKTTLISEFTLYSLWSAKA